MHGPCDHPGLEAPAQSAGGAYRLLPWVGDPSRLGEGLPGAETGGAPRHRASLRGADDRCPAQSLLPPGGAGAPKRTRSRCLSTDPGPGDPLCCLAPDAVESNAQHLAEVLDVASGSDGVSGRHSRRTACGKQGARAGRHWPILEPILPALPSQAPLATGSLCTY